MKVSFVNEMNRFRCMSVVRFHSLQHRMATSTEGSLTPWDKKYSLPCLIHTFAASWRDLNSKCCSSHVGRKVR